MTKQIIESAQASGLPFAPWKEIDIDGSKINFSLTPLGIGLYLGQVKDLVVLSSTEDGIRRISTMGKSGESLYETVKTKSSSALIAGDSVLSGYLNFTRLSDTVKDLQGTLAMFSGGNSNVNEDMIKKLKALGLIDFAVQYSNQKFELQVTYSE